MAGSPPIQFALLGLSPGQFWLVFILSQVGVLLWLARRAIVTGRKLRSRPSHPIENDLTEAAWQARIRAHRVKSLKAQSFQQLQELPSGTIERLRSHGDWRILLHVTRATLPDGTLRLTVTEVGENGFRPGGGGRTAFLARADGTTEDLPG